MKSSVSIANSSRYSAIIIHLSNPSLHYRGSVVEWDSPRFMPLLHKMGKAVDGARAVILLDVFKVVSFCSYRTKPHLPPLLINSIHNTATDMHFILFRSRLPAATAFRSSQQPIPQLLPLHPPHPPPYRNLTATPNPQASPSFSIERRWATGHAPKSPKMRS